MNIQELTHVRRFNFVHDDNGNEFLNTKFTIPNAALSSYQTASPLLFDVKCGLVSEWETGANTHFFICFRTNEVSNCGAIMGIEFFHSFSVNLTRILKFSVLFAKHSLFTSLGRMLRSLVLSKRPLFQTIPSNLFGPKCLFCGFVLFCRRSWVCLNFFVERTSNYLITFEPSSSKSGTMQDILLQRSTVKNGIYKFFLQKCERVVQSRDQANIILTLIQSCNSNPDLFHYVTKLLQGHHSVLLLVWILWNDELRTPNTSRRNQWFHKIYILVHLTQGTSSIPTEKCS